ncbi:hypothetical protein V1264_024314 [Littorina saxatilis]|uniref:Uncharacterized protein n=1 Tax=Littorina saxatilis TaxID=31220 RepID=A0AAN9AMK1_9CAEN
MKLVFVLVLVIFNAVLVMTAPTECVGHGKECTPGLQNGPGQGQCCSAYEWCMGQRQEGGQVVHKCFIILPGK